eukprot:Colp12_sorted_trinity150504_noHs@34894
MMVITNMPNHNALLVPVHGVQPCTGKLPFRLSDLQSEWQLDTTMVSLEEFWARAQLESRMQREHMVHVALKKYNLPCMKRSITKVASGMLTWISQVGKHLRVLHLVTPDDLKAFALREFNLVFLDEKESIEDAMMARGPFISSQLVAYQPLQLGAGGHERMAALQNLQPGTGDQEIASEQLLQQGSGHHEVPAQRSLPQGSGHHEVPVGEIPQPVHGDTPQMLHPKQVHNSITHAAFQPTVGHNMVSFGEVDQPILGDTLARLRHEQSQSGQKPGRSSRDNQQSVLAQWVPSPSSWVP